MSYWCGEQLVVTIDGPGGRRVVELAQPFARVGSHPEADVVIADEAVELRAAYLHATSAGVFCLYLDIETQDLEQKGTWLRPDEQIAIGPYWLSARLAEPKAESDVPAISPAVSGTAAAPLPVLLVYCGSKLKDKRRLGAQLSPLGRRPQCALQLRGEKVSGFHCVLFWERGQLWFVDLNSSNGTQRNGENLVAGRVNIGDRLEVGDFGLVFQRLSSGGAAPPAASPPQQQKVVTASPGAIASPDDATLPAAALAASALPTSQPAGPSPAELAHEADYRRLREEMEQEVSRLAREREQMHEQWQQSSQQLVAQIGQLHDEAARLTGERQALEQSRHEWQAERSALAEQLAERSNQLARLEADLAAATAALAEKLAQVEARPSSLPRPTLEPKPIDETEPALPTPLEIAAPLEMVALPEEVTAASEDRLAEMDVMADAETLREPAPNPSDAPAPELIADSASPAIKPESWSAPPSPIATSRPAVSERDRLPQFVSDRLVHLDEGQRRQQLLWWSAGGIGIAALIALAVTIWMWAF